VIILKAGQNLVREVEAVQNPKEVVEAAHVLEVILDHLALDHDPFPRKEKKIELMIDAEKKNTF